MSLQNKTLQRSIEFEKSQVACLSDKIAQLHEEMQAMKKQCLDLEKEKTEITLSAQSKVKSSHFYFMILYQYRLWHQMKLRLTFGSNLRHRKMKRE